MCLDADERVDERLRDAIEAERAAGFTRAPGYRFARLSEYYGRFLRHSTAYPDRVLRLFDRRRGGFRSDREIHATVSVDGPVPLLQGDRLHLTYPPFLTPPKHQQTQTRTKAH